MKRVGVMILVGLIPFTGCQSDRAVVDTEDKHELRESMVQMLNNVIIDNGVNTQRTIYPHHFSIYTAELNDLGERDLQILASHFRMHAGRLSVRRGDAPEDLYARRMDAVRAYLVAAGVDLTRITIDDALPGGSGRASDEVITILENERLPEGGQGGAGTGTMVGDQSQGGGYVSTR